MKQLVHLATFFGVGKLPGAPGTWGSLAAVPFVYLASLLGPLPSMGIALCVIVAGIFAAEIYERENPDRHDASEIVIDEVAGMFVTMIWLPITWQSFVAGFVLFRILDVWKPYPISVLDEKIPGGVGVMADDLAAGLIANMVLQVLYLKTDWLGIQWFGGLG